MPADALALALAAAVVHAGWNVLLAGARDVPAATGVALLAGTVVFALPALLERSLAADAVPFLVAAIVLQAVYAGMLAEAYTRADLSLIYPVARGAAPVFVLAATTPSALQAAGVLVVVAGVLAVRGWRRPASWADLALALAIGATIAGYTVVDSHGIDHAGAWTYLELEVGGSALLYAGWLLARGARLRPAVSPRAAAAGVGMFAAYGLTLAALDLAPAAAVAAVRETSVVFGVVFAAIVLKERVTAGRFAGALVVVVGVALVAGG